MSAALFWTYISTHSYETQVKKVIRCLDLTEYAYQKLKQLEKDIDMNLWVTRSHKLALTVHFRKPNDDIVFKYTLSNENLLIDGQEERAYSHIYSMEHVTEAKLDEMIADLRKPGAFPPQDTHATARTMQDCMAR